MKSSYIGFALLIGFIFFSACNARKDHDTTSIASEKPQLIVYGSHDCPHCQHFIHLLDSAGIIYDFREVTSDTAKFNEMIKKIREAKIKGYIGYPVIDIKGNILVRPAIKDLMKYLQ